MLYIKQAEKDETLKKSRTLLGPMLSIILISFVNSTAKRMPSLGCLGKTKAHNSKVKHGRVMNPKQLNYSH